MDERDAAGADHLALAILRVDDQAGLLIDAHQGQARRQHLDQAGEAHLPHETAAGVQLLAALAVVPMRDEDQRQAVHAEEIQTGLPVQLLAHFVDLVDGQGIGADGDDGGAGEGDRPTQAMAGEHGIPGLAALQLADGVSGAAGTHEDQVGMVERLDHLGIVRAVGAEAVAGGHGDHLRLVVLQVVLDELAHPPDDLRRVELEAGRRLEQGDAGGVAHAPQDGIEDLLTAGGGLPGTEEDDRSG